MCFDPGDSSHLLADHERKPEPTIVGGFDQPDVIAEIDRVPMV